MNFKGRDKLSQFIANNLKIEFMALTVSKENPFGIILSPLIFEFSKLFQLFKKQLYNEVKRCTKDQTFAVEANLKEEFLPVINDYLNWYNTNKEKTNIHFPKQNPYEYLKNDVLCFKNEILKYFPHLEEKMVNYTKSQHILKELFRDTKDYDNIIKLLIENDFITENKDGTFNWNGCISETSLAHKKLLCTFVLVLLNKNYLKPRLSSTIIVKSLNNTFNYDLSDQYYGQVRKQILEGRISNNKEAQYYSVFHFINPL